VFALRVIVELDVVEHVAARFFAGFVFLAPDPFAFEQVEEALDDGIVPTAATAAHALGKVVLFKKLLPIIAGEPGILPVQHRRCHHRPSTRIPDDR
jgi:hypothetical protein